ncbi:MAG TPA: MFS transporter [Gemmatimonadaceae bacterium]
MEARADDQSSGPFHKLLRRVVDVREGEVGAMLTSFAFFFCLLSSYFILRPMRDAVAAASGVNQISWLFAGTLGATLLCNPLFSSLVVRFPIRRVIPISYQFFAIAILVFYAILRFIAGTEGSAVDVWTGRVFYVWTTVFALFNTSIFWSLMADAFRSDQAKRLFGFIGVGGTLGAISGSAVTASWATTIGPMNLLLVSAALLELGVFIIARFPLARRQGGEPAVRGGRTADADVIGGSVWSGFRSVVTSPYLLGICAFLILYVTGSTFLYYQQADIVGRLYPDRASATAILAKLELAAQLLTVVTQIFFTGRIIRWLGLAVSLALLPALSMLGFGALGALPAFQTLSVFLVLRRASNNALTNPAMEVLFTVVPREDKYKAKNIIETFVYRGGDQVSAWLYTGLVALGLSLAGISFVAVPLAGVWLVLALWLGRKQAFLAQTLTPPVPTRLSQEDSEPDVPLPTPSRLAT